MKKLLNAAMSLALLSAGQVMAQNTERATLLQNSRNIVVSTTDGQRLYHLVNSERTYTARRVEGGGWTMEGKDIASIRFQGIPRFAIDEDSTALGSNYAVTSGLLAFRRSFNIGRWNTIVLPFSLNAAQVRDAFGPETLVASVIRITEDVNEDTNGNANIEFAVIGSDDDSEVLIEEGKPYLIRPTREPDIAEGASTTVTYGSGRVTGPVYIIPGVSVEKGKKSYTPVLVYADGKNTGIRIRGSYNATSINPNRYPNYLLNDEGRFGQLEEQIPVKGFRTWTEMVKNEYGLSPRFYINGIEEDLTLPTAIPTIAHSPFTADRYYDLQGRYVGERLRPGIYIFNGKKVIVR
jgi:hypothetical protein